MPANGLKIKRSKIFRAFPIIPGKPFFYLVILITPLIFDHDFKPIPMLEFFQTLASWYMQHINYYTITLLMAIESSFVPLPSEVVIPPAIWKAASGELNIY